MEQRIVEKAQELFFRYGLKSITMDDIASNLGASKKTLYQYFKDKDSLVDAVVQKEIEQDMQECGRIAVSCDNAVHEVFRAFDMLQEMLTTMNPSIIFEMQKYHPEAYKKMNAHKNKFFVNITKENLIRGIAEGNYREDLNIDILSRYRIESVFLGFNPEIFMQGKFTLVEVEMELMEHFLYGICTPKGQKLIHKYKKQREK
ncbi:MULTISPECIES: TetR/AcrR family transcriptional regulator [Sediminibacterium]|uniref:TetR/AcrR family transcriptional regulator n=1 Tax=Sediminibacterium TaxID=504481 RepID=UPI00047B0BDB|nr:TetR/AcrR family transcriptional regulator [Sediminibacterium salmoneum]